MESGSSVSSFPSLTAAATRFRLIELAEKASLAGLVSFASTVVSFLSYPNVQASPGALLARLEEGLMPLAALTFERDSATGELAQEGVGRTEAIASTQEAGSRHEAGARHEAGSGHEAGSRQDGPQDPSDGDLAPTNRPASRANEARVPAPGGEGRVPAAVGFAADRTLPVSFWFRGELYTIQAVLEGGMEGEDGQRLTVMTQTGIFRLEREGQRWYAQKLD